MAPLFQYHWQLAKANQWELNSSNQERIIHWSPHIQNHAKLGRHKLETCFLHPRPPRFFSFSLSLLLMPCQAELSNANFHSCYRMICNMPQSVSQGQTTADNCRLTPFLTLICFGIVMNKTALAKENLDNPLVQFCHQTRPQVMTLENQLSICCSCLCVTIVSFFEVFFHLHFC